jgi:hypothetical protein
VRRGSSPRQPTTNLISNRPHKAETRYPLRSHVGYAATGRWVTVYVPRLRALGIASIPTGMKGLFSVSAHP